MAANGESLMVRAISRNVFARVWFVAYWALIGRSVPVSLCKFAIVKLAVYEFQKGCTLPSVSRKPTVDGFSHRLCVRTKLYVFMDEATI